MDQNESLCHAVSIYAVVGAILPGNCIDPYGMTKKKNILIREIRVFIRVIRGPIPNSQFHTFQFDFYCISM